jgi:hypothetical protein
MKLGSALRLLQPAVFGATIVFAASSASAQTPPNLVGTWKGKAEAVFVGPTPYRVAEGTGPNFGGEIEYSYVVKEQKGFALQRRPDRRQGHRNDHRHVAAAGIPQRHHSRPRWRIRFHAAQCDHDGRVLPAHQHDQQGRGVFHAGEAAVAGHGGRNNPATPSRLINRFRTSARAP